MTTTSYNPSAIVTRWPDTGDWDYDLYPTKEAADRGRLRCRPDLNPRVVPTSHAKDAEGKVLLIGTGDLFRVEQVKVDAHGHGSVLLIGRVWHDGAWAAGRRSTHVSGALSVYPVLPSPEAEALADSLAARADGVA